MENQRADSMLPSFPESQGHNGISGRHSACDSEKLARKRAGVE
jgi:hypothetical protein